MKYPQGYIKGFYYSIGFIAVYGRKIVKKQKRFLHFHDILQKKTTIIFTFVV